MSARALGWREGHGRASEARRAGQGRQDTPMRTPHITAPRPPPKRERVARRRFLQGLRGLPEFWDYEAGGTPGSHLRTLHRPGIYNRNTHVLARVCNISIIRYISCARVCAHAYLLVLLVIPYFPYIRARARGKVGRTMPDNA